MFYGRKSWALKSTTLALHDRGDWSFMFKVLLLLLSLCSTKLNLRYRPNNATASETLTNNMTLSKESVSDLQIDALTEKCNDRQQRPLYCNPPPPPLYSMGGWLLPQQISDTTKERTSSVFPYFLSPSVTPFLCQCYMNAYLSLRCISIYTNALKMYIINLRIEMDKNGQENPDLRETASNFFFTFCG